MTMSNVYCSNKKNFIVVYVTYKGCTLYDHAQIETRTQLKEDKPTATDRTPYSPAQVAKAIALLVTSVGQVYYLKSFFESKTSI